MPDIVLSFAESLRYIVSTFLVLVATLAVLSCDRTPSDSTITEDPPQKQELTRAETNSQQESTDPRFAIKSQYSVTASTPIDFFTSVMLMGFVANDRRLDSVGSAEQARDTLSSWNWVGVDESTIHDTKTTEILAERSSDYALELQSVRTLPVRVPKLMGLKEISLLECDLSSTDLERLLKSAPNITYLSIISSRKPTKGMLNGLSTLKDRSSDEDITLSIFVGEPGTLSKEISLPRIPAVKTVMLTILDSRGIKLQPLLLSFSLVESLYIGGLASDTILDALGHWFSPDSFSQLSYLNVVSNIEEKQTLYKRFQGELKNLGIYVTTNEELRALPSMLKGKSFVRLETTKRPVEINQATRKSILNECRARIKSGDTFKSLKIGDIDGFTSADFNLLCRACKGGVLSLSDCSFQESSLKGAVDVSLLRLDLKSCSGVSALAPLLGKSSAIETLDLQLLDKADIEALSQMPILRNIGYLNIISDPLDLSVLLTQAITDSQIRAVDLSRCDGLRSLPKLDGAAKVNSGIVINVGANALRESSHKMAQHHGIKIVQQGFPIVR